VPVTSDRPAASASPPAPNSYRERLWPAPWIWASGLLLGASAGLVASPFGDGPALFTGSVAAALLLAGLGASTPAVGVEGDEFVAGRARIPVGLTGAAQPLDAAQLRRAHGTELDARAYLCMRGWIPTGVRVEISDPQDPTPYWLVSTRRPQQLVAALDAARRPVN
jgi:hypothetical protein